MTNRKHMLKINIGSKKIYYDEYEKIVLFRRS